jgi:hypothetical protein
MRILAASPLAYDATSYYRAFGVFPNLKRYMPKLQVDPYMGGGRKTWAELLQYDALFLQRPAHADWLKLAQYCKALGLKVWIDHDDNLFDLPPYNRVSDTYTPQVKKTMLEIMRTADLITVSTPAIQSYFAGLGCESHVVSNALNTDLTPMAIEYNAPQEGKNEQFIWRGSETHIADCLFFTEPMATAMEGRDKTFWHFLGYHPFMVTMSFPPAKWKYHIPEDIMVYNENLRSIKGQIMHVPLVEDGLNKCKSNIAWIEATAAGMATIAPDWQEWKHPGIINYTSIEDYGIKLMRSTDNNQELWKASRDYIMDNLTLNKINEQRATLLNNLFA